MVKAKILIILPGFLLIFLSSCGTIKKTTPPVTIITHLGETGEVKDGSLVYALPMTVLGVTVELERKIEKAGPYARYAGELLGIKDVILKDSESWEIRSVTVSSFEEPDPSEFYIIEAGTIVETNALALKRSGLILDINSSILEKGENSNDRSRFSQGDIKFNDLGAAEYFHTQSDTAYRVVRLDTTFVKIPYLVEKKKQLSPDQLAESAAKTVLDLRDGKIMLLTGETNVYPQSSASIDELNRLENEYTALFAGKSARETVRLNFTVVPQKDKPATELFRLSKSTGPSEPGSKMGDPVVIDIKSAVKTRDITYINRPASDDKPVETYDRLYYRMPDVSVITVSSKGIKLFESRRLVYQYGQVLQLPANYIIGK